MMMARSSAQYYIPYYSTVNTLDSLRLDDGQVFIGRTGNSPVSATLTGTAGQVNIASGAGSVVLSLPQSINTAASPTFSSLTLTGVDFSAYGVAVVNTGGVIRSTAAGDIGKS